MFVPYIINLPQTVWVLWPVQDFCFKGDNYITKKVRVVSLARDMPTGPPFQPYEILSNYLKQYGMACTRFRIQGRLLHNEDSESCLSCTRHAYWSSSSFLRNIIKICLMVSNLWSAQGCVYGRTDAMLIVISHKLIGRR